MSPSFYLLSFLALGNLAIAAEIISFDKSEVGKSPLGWTSGVTGKGKSKWTVEKDPTAPSSPNVLKQSAEGQFPWCVKEDSMIQNGWAEVKFKTISGNEDKAAGLIFRFQNSDNYYVARANALEENITIYHTLDGKRRAFQSTRAVIAQDKWHTLRIEFTGNHFIVLYDGTKTLEATDEKIKLAGKVGLWTKADSVTLFDDFGYSEK